MKLAIVIPGFQSSPGDWCIPAFTNLARELSRHAEVHVFALRYPHRHDRYRIGNVNVHSMGGGAFAGTRYPILSLLNLWRMARREVEQEHRRAPFDRVIGFWATESGWLGSQIGKRLRVRTIVHLAGGELTWLPMIGYGNWGRGLSGWMVKRTLKAADMLTVPSGLLARQLISRAPHAARKALRWPLGVDTSMFVPGSGQASPDFRFIAVGSLIHVKGYDLLLDSFARFLAGVDADERHRVHLTIVGSGPLLGQLQQRVSELDLYRNLEGYVSFAGDVPHDKLPDLYRDASCFVCTSRHEAQCMAALEAMSCGLPWIGLPVGALGDVARLAELPSGIAVEAWSPRTMAQAISQIYALTPEERKRMGENARRIILREYDLKAQTARLLILCDRTHIVTGPIKLTPPSPSDRINALDL